MSEKEKLIARAIFGEGPKDETVLDKVVYKNYGIGQEGFNISSCQFAFHYFFENSTVLQNFMRNLSECTALGGYFIGTCFDGKTVFNMLQEYNKNDGITITQKDNKVWSITKQYSSNNFEDDITSLGYPINVYQESIGQEFKEYLVNFKYVNRIMENYGFIRLPPDEAKQRGFPYGSGMFKELYDLIDLKQNPLFKMKDYEKTISFLNRYFIYKKVRNVDASKISLEKQEVILEVKTGSENQESSVKTKTDKKIKKLKLKKK